MAHNLRTSAVKYVPSLFHVFRRNFLALILTVLSEVALVTFILLVRSSPVG